MHLVVSISGHGFGHVSQVAPILNALHRRWPDWRLTVRSSAPLGHLRSRIHAPFAHLPSEGDVGMVMLSPLAVDVAASRALYRDFHADWAQRVAAEAALLRQLQAEAVLSDVGYLALAGAQQAGIPNAALCSLNWADIYRHYCGADAIAAQIHAAYAAADAFLCTTPGMAMSDLSNRRRIGPLADLGRNRRAELAALLQLAPDEKVVLVSLGGIASRVPMENWPVIPGVRWLVQQSWQVRRPDAVDLETLPIPFADLLPSSDALLTKPGYGSFVESACAGVPLLYAARPDWPESPCLVDWLHQHGVCREITPAQLDSGDIATDLAALWAMPAPPRPTPHGAADVLDYLAERLPARA